MLTSGTGFSKGQVVRKPSATLNLPSMTGAKDQARSGELSYLSESYRSDLRDAADTYWRTGRDTASMGAAVLFDLDCSRYSGLHRHIGRIRGCRAHPILHFRRDLPGASDPGVDNIQGIGSVRPRQRTGNLEVSGPTFSFEAPRNEALQPAISSIFTLSG